ncbi:MAG: hypothetical protein WC367_00580 [Methanoregula sp.]|jgi:hypothetical protein
MPTIKKITKRVTVTETTSIQKGENAPKKSNEKPNKKVHIGPFPTDVDDPR